MTSIPREEVPSARLLLAVPDTLCVSADIAVSERMMTRLDQDREKAQQAEGVNRVHCPDWLGAQVHPHCARGGYRVLIETPDFSVKVLGAGIPNRPGLFVELRSQFLHTHPAGPEGASRGVGVAADASARRSEGERGA